MKGLERLLPVGVPPLDVLIAVQRARVGQVRTNMPLDRRMQRLELGLPCLIEALEAAELKD